MRMKDRVRDLPEAAAALLLLLRPRLVSAESAAAPPPAASREPPKQPNKSQIQKTLTSMRHSNDGCASSISCSVALVVAAGSGSMFIRDFEWQKVATLM